MPRITELYAWVVEDAGPDDEGVIGIVGPGGGISPAMGADRARAESYRAWAKSAAGLQGKPVRLLRFSIRETIEEVMP